MIKKIAIGIIALLIAAFAYSPAPAQYSYVRDVDNECPYVGYLTAFSTPDTS